MPHALSQSRATGMAKALPLSLPSSQLILAQFLPLSLAQILPLSLAQILPLSLVHANDSSRCMQL